MTAKEVEQLRDEILHRVSHHPEIEQLYAELDWLNAAAFSPTGVAES